MRRKILQDFANTLCQMAVGWRIAEDLEALIALGGGVISIDLIEGQATHETLGNIDLRIAGELQAWLQHRLRQARIPPTALAKAEMIADIRTQTRMKGWKRVVVLDSRIAVTLATDERQYSASLHEVHQWHLMRVHEPGSGPETR